MGPRPTRCVCNLPIKKIAWTVHVNSHLNSKKQRREKEKKKQRRPTCLNIQNNQYFINQLHLVTIKYQTYLYKKKKKKKNITITHL